MPSSLGTEKRPATDGIAGDNLSHYVLDYLSEGCQIIDSDFRYLYVNDTAAVHGRTTKDQLLGRNMMEAYPGIENTDMFILLRRCMEEHSPYQMENEFTFPDGSKSWFELRFDPIPEGVFILSMEITACKRIETELRRSNRALTVLSKCNQHLVRATDENRFMEDVCKIVVDKGGYGAACVGLMAGDDRQAALSFIVAGLEEDGHAGISYLVWDEEKHNLGPAICAVRSGQIIVRHWVDSDSDQVPWRNKALELGFASCIALPILCNETYIGALTIFAVESDAFTDEEHTFLGEMALDIGYGIETLRSRVAHRQADARIWHLNSVLRGICNINQLIARERAPKVLIGRACELLVESRGFNTSCIIICDGDRVTYTADAGESHKLCALRRMLLDNEVPDCVRCALRETGFSVRSNSAKVCINCPINEDCSDEQDAIAVCMKSADKVFGVLLVSLPPSLASDEKELDLLIELASDLAFALQSIEIQSEREKAEAAIVISESRYRDLNRRLLRLARFIQDLSAARNMEIVTQIVRKAARDLNGADGATVILRNGDQCHYVDEDAIQPLWKGMKFPMSVCISGWVMIHRQPVAIVDVYSDDRIPCEAYRSTFVKSLVMVPIRSDNPVGAMGTYWARPYRAAQEEIEIMQALADATSVAIENVRVLRELEEERARVRAIFDHLPNAAFIWKRTGDVGFVLSDINEAARVVTEGRASDLLGSSPHDPRYSFPHLVEDLSNVFDDFIPVRRELECSMPNTKETRRLVLTYGFIPSDMVILHTEDITDQRRTEEQLTVSQRLEAIGRLAGGMAHDFNNLLSVIINYADFAIDELNERDPARAHVMQIRKAGQRAAALTRQLLAFSRKQVLEPVVINLNSVITGIESMLSRLLGEDIEIILHLADELGRTIADPGQIEQVIMNLAVNARDAMLRGGKLIITTSNVDLDDDYSSGHIAVKSGRYVLLSVSDTGCGMDAETRDRVFEPFFTTKEKGKGTGLGLSTVYGIVKQSNGNIWAYSEPELGTTFKVYLPRVDAPAIEIATKPPIANITGNETVLVAEDEDAVRNLTVHILQTAGYNVISAKNGDAALLLSEKLDGRNLHLLLTDVVMPEMSGRELAERLTERIPSLKTLYMSGYTDNAIVHHGVLKPGVCFISKPFTAADLTRKVREVLDRDIK
jgi:PAS domain S-box-containing protein